MASLRIPTSLFRGSKIAARKKTRRLRLEHLEDRAMMALYLGSGPTIDGLSPNGFSNISLIGPQFSADGTKFVFTSDATNLVPEDTIDFRDVFLKDLVTGVITRVNTGTNGEEDNRGASSACISSDGTKVYFSSLGSNLVPGDTNEVWDIFEKNLITGAVTRLSTNSLGGQSAGQALDPCISSDGTKLLFFSDASDLVEGDTNGVAEVFMKDLVTGLTTRVSVGSGGEQGDQRSWLATFSGDGTKVVFESDSTTLVDGDTNGTSDIFVKDLLTGEVVLVSASASGEISNGFSQFGRLSYDGTKVAFYSYADNLVSNDTNGNGDVFVKDLATGVVTLASTNASGEQGNGLSIATDISADGTKVLMSSSATNLLANDGNADIQDVMEKNLVTGEVTAVSVNDAGEQANGFSYGVYSTNATKVAFASYSTNLVPEVTSLAFSAQVYISAPKPTIDVTSSDGTLTFTFTEGDDQADIEYLAGTNEIRLSGSFQTETVSLAGITRVVINALGGKDTVRIASSYDSGRPAMDIFGGNGLDVVTVEGVVRDITTGDGADSVVVAVSAEVRNITTEDGDDSVSVDGTATGISTGADADSLVIGLSGIVMGSITTGDGADAVTVDGEAGSISTDGGADTIVVGLLGTVMGDVSLGAQDDLATIYGAVDGRVFGEDGNDRIAATAVAGVFPTSSMRFFGGAGSDLLYGGAGEDWLDGGADRDGLDSGAGNDTLIGNDGEDFLFAGAGNDILLGGEGTDILYGEDGDDLLNGGTGNDVMIGNAGNDVLIDLSGWNFLIGGAGSDVLTGGGTNGNLHLADKWSSDGVERVDGIAQYSNSNMILRLLERWATSSEFSTLQSRITAVTTGPERMGLEDITDDGSLDVVILSATSADAYFEFAGDLVLGKTNTRNRRIN